MGGFVQELLRELNNFAHSAQRSSFASCSHKLLLGFFHGSSELTLSPQTPWEKFGTIKSFARVVMGTHVHTYEL